MPFIHPRSRRAALSCGTFLRAAPFLLAPLASGCAAQLGLGSATGGDDLTPRVITAEARSFAPRKLGPFIGLGATSVVGGDGRAGLFPRNAFLSAGLHLPTSRPTLPRLGGEFALELGAGEPARKDFGGLGAYTGGSGVALLRLAGPDDGEPRFDVLTPLFDLALSFRGGFWTAPEGMGGLLHPEAAMSLALRVTLTSDLAAPRRPDPRPPETPESSPGAFH